MRFPLDFTLCFLTRPGEVLLLHRNKPPNQGKWNGVGGHIEPGETPLAACLREVREETGYQVQAARFGGLLTWQGFEIPPGGLYLFTAAAPAGAATSGLEGRLAWQPTAWAWSAPEVVDNLHHVLPPLLEAAAPAVYHFEYADGHISRHTLRHLPAGFNPQAHVTALEMEL